MSERCPFCNGHSYYFEDDGLGNDPIECAACREEDELIDAAIELSVQGVFGDLEE